MYLKLEYTGEVPSESSQYDFFIGEWDVVVKEHNKEGQVVDSAKGVWWAKYLHDKRVVFDDVVFSDGHGKIQPGFPSLRTYSPKLLCICPLCQLRHCVVILEHGKMAR